MKGKYSVLGLMLLIFALLIFAKVARTLRAMPADSPGVAVNIENNVYNPNPVTVSIGTTVRWTNQDVVPHNVVSEDKTFKSRLLEKGEQFSFTFTKPGTFKYICSIHPKMVAKVIVQ